MDYLIYNIFKIIKIYCKTINIYYICVSNLKNKIMKTFGKKSLTSVLKTILSIALVLELVVILAHIGNIYYHCLPLKDSMQETMLFMYISIILFLIIAFFVTLQLRKLLSSFNKETFFEPVNVRRIQNISILLFSYVIISYLLTVFDPSATFKQHMPNELINAFAIFTKGLDIKTLFLATVIYIISHVFKKGCELQDQTNLTI